MTFLLFTLQIYTEFLVFLDYKPKEFSFSLKHNLENAVLQQSTLLSISHKNKDLAAVSARSRFVNGNEERKLSRPFLKG